MDEEKQRVKAIAKRNDLLRDTFLGGRVVVTAGVRASGLEEEILTKVREFRQFTKANDPYGEHDFGSFVVEGVRLFWKIDYTDGKDGYWCDPLSPACQRVLTIMLAEEY